jgi:hypothetical protein
MLKYFLAIGLLLGPADGYAAFVTGNDLYDRCEHASIGATSNFAMGVADTYQLLVNAHETVAFFCIPLGVEARQLVDVACQYLKANPATRNQSAAGLAAVAFSEAWPC